MGSARPGRTKRCEAGQVDEGSGRLGQRKEGQGKARPDIKLSVSQPSSINLTSLLSSDVSVPPAIYPLVSHSFTQPPIQNAIHPQAIQPCIYLATIVYPSIIYPAIHLLRHSDFHSSSHLPIHQTIRPSSRVSSHPLIHPGIYAVILLSVHTSIKPFI